MSSFYNSRPLIAEVMVKDNKFEIVRKKLNCYLLANMTELPISQGRVMIVDDRTSEKTACYSVKTVCHSVKTYVMAIKSVPPGWTYGIHSEMASSRKSCSSRSRRRA